MAHTTSRRSLPQCDLSDTAHVPRDVNALAAALDNDAVDVPQDTLANRPAAGAAGRYFFSTDENVLYRSNGSAWKVIGPYVLDDSVTSAKIAADAVGSSEIAAGAVTTSEIADGTITKTDLAAAVQEALWDVGDIKPAAYPVTAGAEPSGWLLCDGRAVSRATYAALYAKLGGGSSPFGQGDGSTTFNLPDYQGRSLVGKGTMSQVDAVGDNEGLAVGSRKRSHHHAVSATGSGYTGYTDTAHYHTGTTDGMNANNPHSHPIGYGVYAISDGSNNAGWPAGSGYYKTTGVASAVASQDINHGHTFTTGGASGGSNHRHDYSVNVSGSAGDGAGPLDCEPFSVVNYLIKA